MPKPQQTDQPCAGFVFLVDKWRLCDTFKSGLIDEVEEMNKQELIDKLIHSTGGKLDDMNYLVYFADAGFNVRLSEIKQRAIELGYKPADETPLDNGAAWYNYEAQKSTKYPPAGTECYFNFKGKLIKVFVIGFDKYGHICLMINGGTKCFGGFKSNFKPITYEAEKKRVVDAFCKFFDDHKSNTLQDIADDAYDAGFLRMPDAPKQPKLKTAEQIYGSLFDKLCDDHEESKKANDGFMSINGWEIT